MGYRREYAAMVRRNFMIQRGAWAKTFAIIQEFVCHACVRRAHKVAAISHEEVAACFFRPSCRRRECLAETGAHPSCPLPARKTPGPQGHANWREDRDTSARSRHLPVPYRRLRHGAISVRHGRLSWGRTPGRLFRPDGWPSCALKHRAALPEPPDFWRRHGSCRGVSKNKMRPPGLQ